MSAEDTGYGLSDPADSDHVSVAEDTLAVADLLGVERFAVLGMSAARWARALPAQDAALLANLPAGKLAASVREALHRVEGYLRDAAVTFRAWDFRPELVSCPTHLWYGELDGNAPSRNGEWLAAHVPRARLLQVRPGTTHLATLLEQWDDIVRPLGASLRRGS